MCCGPAGLPSGEKVSWQRCTAALATTRSEWVFLALRAILSTGCFKSQTKQAWAELSPCLSLRMFRHIAQGRPHALGCIITSNAQSVFHKALLVFVSSSHWLCVCYYGCFEPCDWFKIQGWGGKWRNTNLSLSPWKLWSLIIIIITMLENCRYRSILKSPENAPLLNLLLAFMDQHCWKGTRSVLMSPQRQSLPWYSGQSSW